MIIVEVNSPVFDGDPTARTRYPSMVIELVKQFWDEIPWVLLGK
jgi:hypothetical protein